MSAPKYRWTNPRFGAVVPASQFGRWLSRLPDQNPATIVQSAADPKSPAHALFVDFKAQWFYQVQPATGVGRQSNDVSGVWRNFRLEKYDVKQGGRFCFESFVL